MKPARVLTAALVAALASSCAEKGPTDPGVASGTKFALQVIAPASQTAEVGPTFLFTAAWYNTTSSTGAPTRVMLGSKSVALGASSQNVSLSLDIGGCLLDTRRSGPQGVCRIDVIAALVADTATFLGSDTNYADRSWDFALIQGLDAARGQSPTIPPIELSLTRFDQPSRLVFRTQPPAFHEAGTPISVQVAVEKQKGGTATTATPMISLVLSGAGSPQLSGVTSRAAVNGIATFSGLTVDKVGSGYVLTAVTAGLASGSSTPFAATSPAPPPPPPPSGNPNPPPASVNAYDGTYPSTGVVTADDGSSTTSSGTTTVASGNLSFTVDGFTMTGAVALSGLVTFVIPPDAAARCNPTSMTAQITISASGVATIVGSGSQNNRGISPTGGCIPGRLTFTFLGTRVAGLQVAVAAGNNQSAAPGAAVAIAPSVIVRNGSGNPVGGVNVTFAVASGAGSITNATRTTGADGVATVGSWTLGATAGSNTLTATVAGATGSPVTFTATATSQATAADFAGVWTGSATAVCTACNPVESHTQQLMLMLTMNNGVLSATSNGQQMTNVLVSNGVLTFTWPRSAGDANDPFCASWNMSASATLDATRQNMSIRLFGLGCGTTPATQAVDVTTTLTRGDGATLADFAGTWSGSVTGDANTDGVTEEFTYGGILRLAVNGGVLTGTSEDVSPKAEPPRPISNVSFSAGILTFNLPTDTANPDCANFDMRLTGVLDASRTRMTIYVAGRGCAPVPQTTTFSGTGLMTRTP